MSLGVRMVMCGVYAALAWLMRVACELHEPLMVWMVAISLAAVVVVDVVETLEYVNWVKMQPPAPKGELHVELDEWEEWIA